MAPQPPQGPSRLTVRYLISGVVQGVGFRWFVHRRATAAGVGGWVRNLPDGRVEAMLAGDPAAVAAVEAAIRTGPRGATVGNVEKVEISDQADVPKPFEIR